MQPLHTDDLVRLVKIMNDMYDYAMSSDWQGLSRLDNERRGILEQAPSAVVNIKADVAQNIQPTEQLPHTSVNRKTDSNSSTQRDFLITEIRSLDKRILELVQSRRQRLLDENRGLSAQRKAKDLYAKTNSIT